MFLIFSKDQQMLLQWFMLNVCSMKSTIACMKWTIILGCHIKEQMSYCRPQIGIHIWSIEWCYCQYLKLLLKLILATGHSETISETRSLDSTEKYVSYSLTDAHPLCRLGIVRIDPLHFLTVYRKRQPNQAIYLSLNIVSWLFCCLLWPLFVYC